MIHKETNRQVSGTTAVRIAISINPAAGNPDSAQLRTRAEILSKQLGFPLIDAAQASSNRGRKQSTNEMEAQGDDYDYLLLADEPGHLTLQPTSGAHGPVGIDFRQGQAAHRQQFGGGRGQPLARAIGLGKDGVNTVVDATAGFGSDAFVLATLGLEVTLLERSPVLALMLDEAISVARAEPATAAITSRMSVHQADSTNWLENSTGVAADVIYLDPMYPTREQSAKVKKGMQLLHKLIGPDADSDALLLAALKRAGRRVVVKRPTSAAPLVPDTELGIQRVEVRSPNTRYDIYPVHTKG